MFSLWWLQLTFWNIFICFFLLYFSVWWDDPVPFLSSDVDAAAVAFWSSLDLGLSVESLWSCCSCSCPRSRRSPVPIFQNKTKPNNAKRNKTRNNVMAHMRPLSSARLTSWKRWLKIAVFRLYRARSKSKLTLWIGPTIHPCGTKSSTAQSTSKRTRMSATKSFRSKPGRFVSLCVVGIACLGAQKKHVI